MSTTRYLAAAGAAALLLALGGAGGADAADARAPQPRTGEQIYNSTCAACHQPDGAGTGEAYPPVAESEYVTGPEGRLVRILLHGLTGEIEVAGQTYSGMMPGWASSFTDAELAAVATYIRASFGNHAPAVSATTVAQVRAAYPGRTALWTAAELARVMPVEKK